MCDPQAPPFRRDTHDGDVPPDIITQLLPLALSLCPNLKVVILERLGETIRSRRDEERLRQDFCAVVQDFKAKLSPSPAMTITTNGARQEPNARSEGKGDDTERLASAKREAIVEGSSAARPCEDEELGRYQAAFLRLFIQDLTPDQLLHELRTLPDFAPYQKYVEGFDRRCTEVASTLVHKWVRFRQSPGLHNAWRKPWWLEEDKEC